MVRVKLRYVLAAAAAAREDPDSDPPPHALARGLRATAERLFGDVGDARMASLRLKYWNPLSRVAIFACARADLPVLAAVLAAHESPRLVQLHTSGSIRQCQRNAALRAQERLASLRSE